MGAVMAAASSFEARSRNNSVEVPPEAQKDKVGKIVEKEKAVEIKKVDDKKIAVAPPPRKSSDPTHKTPAVVTSPQHVQPPQSNKPESPKVKISNGSLPHSAQVQKIISNLPIQLNISENDTKKEEGKDMGESSGVGDKIRQFERAAEDAGGKISRAGSVRKLQESNPTPGTLVGQSTGSNQKINNTHNQPTFEKTPSKDSDKIQVFSPPTFSKWRKEDPGTPVLALKNLIKCDDSEKAKKLQQEMPVKSPALSARNYADRAPTETSQLHTRNASVSRSEPDQSKTCNYKSKYSSAKSSYFTRGTEEMWMVKKKDIEEIEDRVLESFRRAGANIPGIPCQPEREFPFTTGASTLGRVKRAAYARSESLEPRQAPGRAQTLKRQSSVACTCAHDKRGRGSAPATAAQDARPRSRSHGDDHSQHVLDKYETLV